MKLIYLVGLPKKKFKYRQTLKTIFLKKKSTEDLKELMDLKKITLAEKKREKIEEKIENIRNVGKKEEEMIEKETTSKTKENQRSNGQK